MKTQLPEKITTVEEAKKFLTELHKNNESYHPEDDAHGIIDWHGIENEKDKPTIEECDRLNKLMSDIYAFPGNEDAQNMVFDPCEFLLIFTNYEIYIEELQKLKKKAEGMNQLADEDYEEIDAYVKMVDRNIMPISDEHFLKHTDIETIDELITIFQKYYPIKETLG